jgi:hypothetical protein
MVRGLPLLRRGQDDHVLVQSPTEIREEQEKLSSIVTKPFRCFAGRDSPSSFLDDDYAPYVTSPDEQYIPPGENDYGFEATLQEGRKKKTKSLSFRKNKEKKDVVMSESSSLERNRSLEKAPSNGYLTPYPFPGSGSIPKNGAQSRSFEDLPPGTDVNALPRMRTRSFADVIPAGKKNDPLDNESIRDVSKALREMERKLEAAGAEGKKVSRTKVMKALLTVVDQLDDQYAPESSYDLPPSSSLNSSAELYRTWAGGSNNTSATSAAEQEAIALDRQRRNLEQMRELTITPNRDYSGRAGSPWKGDKPSFSRMTEELKAATTEETEAEPDYISSSSDDVEEEETLFSEETEESFPRNKKKQGTQKGSFAHAVYDEDNSTAFFSEDTPSYQKRGKSKKGSFAHAVSPSAARSTTSNTVSPNLDMFNLDVRDPAVQDALSDLLWIPSPTKSVEQARPKVSVVSPETPSSNGHDPVLNKLRKESESMLSYQSEQEYYDKPDLESATSTTQSSFSASSSQHQQKKTGRRRENSWWQRRNRALKPSSKDTPGLQQEQPRLETRVTVTSYDDGDDNPWKPDVRWQEH